MERNSSRQWVKLTLMGVMIFIIGCGLFQDPISSTKIFFTSTPTPESGIVITSSPAPVNGCAGTSGSLEMQVLAGPAEAVGLEPFAVGIIPFSIVKNGQSYNIQGNGTIAYHRVLEKDWGTYTVNMDMNAVVSGDCSGNAGSEELHMVVEASGDQLVEVRADGFEGDYPWPGTHKLSLVFPLTEGASTKSEGWAFILHLNK